MFSAPLLNSWITPSTPVTTTHTCGFSSSVLPSMRSSSCIASLAHFRDPHSSSSPKRMPTSPSRDSEYDQGASLVGEKLTFLVNADAGGKPAKFRYTEVHS